MLALEELHGIEVRTDYRSDHEGTIFADLIDLSIAAALKLKVNSINLIVALADGLTDAAFNRSRSNFRVVSKYRPFRTRSSENQYQLFYD